MPILSDRLHAELVAYLGQHPRRSDPDAALWPGRSPGSGHPLDYDRRWDSSNWRRWYFRPAVRAAGLPDVVRLHDLRHTFASLMFAAGVEPYKVSRWMGHANLATTDGIYAHLYERDHAADAARFEAFIAAGSG